MADNVPPLPDSPPPVSSGKGAFNVWMERAGLPGLLLAIGGIVGVLMLLYPLLAGGALDAVGMIALLAFIAVTLSSWFIFTSAPPQKKTWLLVGVIAAGVAGLLGLYLLIKMLQYTFVFWGFMVVLAAAAVVTGAIMAARKEKLF